LLFVIFERICSIKTDVNDLLNEVCKQEEQLQESVILVCVLGVRSSQAKMAAIGTALMGMVLGHIVAVKAFHPWWDSLEDYLIYGLVMLGIILLPTAIITGTPLDRNYCQADHCSSTGKEYVNDKEDPKFNAWWVKSIAP
jgi:hypothetical protein